MYFSYKIKVLVKFQKFIRLFKRSKDKKALNFKHFNILLFYLVCNTLFICVWIGNKKCNILKYLPISCTHFFFTFNSRILNILFVYMVRIGLGF